MHFMNYYWTEAQQHRIYLLISAQYVITYGHQLEYSNMESIY